VRHPGNDAEVRHLRVELLDAHRELARLRVQNEQLIATNRDLSLLLSSSAQRTGELVKLVVAFRCLLEPMDAATALRNIEEILINVIGTEDFSVMLRTDQAAMQAVAGMGPVHADARATPPTMAEVTETGFRVIPMYIADNVVGAIIIRELLPHRDGLNASDDQVLSLVSQFGACAVMAAAHRKEWSRKLLSDVT
jgi:hypothetical protein